MQTQENIVQVSAAKGIDVGKIEKELAAMWKPADGSKEGSAESGVTRACALNLLVYSSVTDDRREMEEILDAVCEQHPSRTLLLMTARQRRPSSTLTSQRAAVCSAEGDARYAASR